MLKKRLIACLLWRDGLLVQSVNFVHTNFVGNALTAIDFFNTWAVDEIVLLDVSRSKSNRALFHENLKELSRLSFVPLSVGGWINSTAEIKQLLHAGADKVVINTHAFENPDFISEAAKMFGNQCIVVSIDSKRTSIGNEVFVDRGQKATGKDVAAWALEAEQKGAGEIFLTSIDMDGTRAGFDLDLIKNVSAAVNIPVIASGGVGDWSHLAPAVKSGAEAVSAANIFHYSEHSTKKAKDALIAAGIDVRPPEFYKILLPRKPVYKI